MAHLKNPFRMAVVLLFGALVLTACQAFEYTEVDVEMGRERVEGHSEGFVHTNAPSVVEGEITFVVKNEGEFNHNFIVLETDLDPDKLILKGARVDLGASGKERGLSRLILPTWPAKVMKQISWRKDAAASRASS